MDLETENDSPNHTKDHLEVSIDQLCREKKKRLIQRFDEVTKRKENSGKERVRMYTFGGNADQFDTFVSDELEALTGVLDLVNSHCGLLVELLNLVTSNHCQELSELDAIGEVSTDLLDAGSNLSEVRVAPC